MSDCNVKVNTKTHSGGRIRTIENTFISMNDTDSNRIKDKDVILLHVGTNNISDADSSQYIVHELKDTIHTVKTINSKCKIIISLILPRRNDKLVNTIISETNNRFIDLCRWWSPLYQP
jgi:UDP-glucose 6-dehydrogenase